MSDTPLARRHCKPCTPGSPPLSEDRVHELHALLNPAWRLQSGSIRRDLNFSNFRDAFAFATRVGMLAESEGHHPDLEVSWGRLVINLTTHITGGLTENDFILAARIDKLSDQA